MFISVKSVPLISEQSVPARQESYPAAHVLAHEFGHAIVNVVMNEMGGKLNGIDFGEMTREETRDWSIRFTNTVMKAKGKAMETGEGQHDRDSMSKPKSTLKPINE